MVVSQPVLCYFQHVSNTTTYIRHSNTKEHHRVVAKRRFNAQEHDLSSISGRINALLDFAGYNPKESSEGYGPYSPPNDGRSRELADEYGTSKSGANNWVTKNKLPARPLLKQIVQGSLIKMEESFSVGAVSAWIEYGNDVPCPFT